MIELGGVTVSGGTLLMVDPGLLRHWCGRQSPRLEDASVDAETAERARTAVDLEIVGAGAEAVGRALDLQWHPRFLYDQPAHCVDDRRAAVAAQAKALGVEADLRVLPGRVSHRERVSEALAHGQGVGEVQFDGIWATVIGDLPRSRLRVTAEPMPADHKYADRWLRVTLHVRDGEIARQEQVSHVAVDHARILFVDVDDAELWTCDETLDGRADFVFWGRDAEVLAAECNVPALSESSFGWRDLPIREIPDLGAEVERRRDAGDLKVATDFRPHSHLYQLMEQIRAHEHGVGVVSIGQCSACGFMTSWGDGQFEVHRDVDAAGRLLRVRLELGTAARVRLMERVELRWFTTAIVSQKVTEEHLPVRFLYRARPHDDGDSGWRLFSGFEDDEYNDDASNFTLVRLSDLPNSTEIDPLLDEPVGSVFEKEPGADGFVRVDDWTPDEN